MFNVNRGDNVTRQRGVVLVVVLWLLVLLEVLVASQVVSARVESELVRNRVDALSARAAAEAGLFMTIDLLARQQGKKEELLRTDGGVYSMDYNNINVMVSVLDEAGKIDLNAARPELLQNLFVSLTQNAEKGVQISDAIIDWRDVDHVRREAGAEDEEYQAIDKPYGAKDEYFDNLEELLLVLGMDGDLYAKLTAIVTVNTGEKGINPAVAQRTVLLAIPGVKTEQVDVFLQARERYYTQAQAMPLFPVRDNKYINQNRDQLYSIHVKAVTPGGTTERVAALTRVSAQAARHGGLPYEIISWNANDRSAMLQLQ
ncbi:MAG: hypothetical protein ABFS08_11360 [Pseudomonadota bacterium]